MAQMERYIRNFLFTFLLFLFGAMSVFSEGQKKRFTLVIDAGHGGTDPGAVGRISKEKDINLKVALEFGRLVEENCSDVKVIYTRKTDVFLSLDRRATIANRNNADLFVSIHTNALPKGRIAYGTETYTLGMARAAANLEVAKRENSVICLEENYQQTYEGFDPNRAESYIIFEFMQDRYMKQSVDLASCIQKQYTRRGRKNKGVHQAGFLVLRKTSMPAVLTELGFISTPEEERYLSSKKGVRELGRSIYDGFMEYRRLQSFPTIVPPSPSSIVEEKEVPVQQAPLRLSVAEEKKPEPKVVQTAAPAEVSVQKTVVPVAPAVVEEKQQPSQLDTVVQKEKSAPVAVSQSNRPVFKVQLFALDRCLPETDKSFKGLKGVAYYKEGAMYKYTYGSTESIAEARKLQRTIAEKFPKTFVVAFINGKRVELQTAIKISQSK